MSKKKKLADWKSRRGWGTGNITERATASSRERSAESR